MSINRPLKKWRDTGTVDRLTGSADHKVPHWRKCWFG